MIAPPASPSRLRPCGVQRGRLRAWRKADMLVWDAEDVAERLHVPPGIAPIPGVDAEHDFLE
eukprot:14616026-Alexandrium_andersonii.AAC.1